MGYVDIRDSALVVEEVVRRVEHAGAGAAALFIGVVRDENEGRPVVLLEYEAYRPMAIREMGAIASEIELGFAGVRVAAVHRVGRLSVGESAVVCAASSKHRGEAFAACRKLIDEIKARVPIWKREYGPDGAYWVGWHDARCTGDESSVHHGHEHGHDHGDHKGD